MIGCGGYAGAGDDNARAAQNVDTRTCTCHPDDSPPMPCARKFALRDCRLADVARRIRYAADMANELLKRFPDAPFAACWFQVEGGKRQFSLRSDDSRMDVSEVAKMLGGGGHRNAAGFVMAA